jgi:hypothetical protein
MAPNEALLGYVPHFDVKTVNGQHVLYKDIWQRRNLVLVLASSDERQAAVRYSSRCQERRDEFEKEETAVVVTTDSIAGLSPLTVIVADRWGEILDVETSVGKATFAFPDVDELLSWVHFAQIQCPECPP